MKRLFASMFLVSSVAILCAVRDAGPVRAGEPNASYIGAGVIEALEQAPSVRVIVSLLGEAATQTPGNAAAKQSAIAAAADRVLTAVRAPEFEVVHRYRATPALAGTASAAGVKALAAQPDVVNVALDRVVHADLAEAVPLIRADDAHNLLGATGAGVVAAVLDTGIDTDHPMLADSLVYQACFLTAPYVCPPGPNVAEDGYGHGTHVSGIITSNGPPVGVAPGAAIEAFKVLDDSGSGSFWDILAAYDEIILDHPEIRLINMSLGDGRSYAAGTCETFIPAFTAALAATRAMGITSFVAAGNNTQKEGLGYPACLNDAVSVGAVYDADVGAFGCDTTTAADQVACFSQSYTTLDLLAPGATITSTYVGGGLATLSGTSMASPMALGVAALVLQGEPSLSSADLVARLKDTGVAVLDPANGVTTCRVDAYEAVINDGGPVCASARWPAPANDDFAGAIAIPEPLPYTNVQSTASSTTEPGEPMPCGNIGATVWYSVTPSNNETLRVSTAGSGFASVLAVYTGTSVDALSAPLACGSPQIALAAAAGTTYYIQAGGFAGTSGSLTISVGRPPANDDFANAIVIPTALPYSNAQSTMLAATDPGEPTSCAAIGATVWYSVTLSSQRAITISTAGSGFDTVLALHTGASVDALSPLYCNRNFVGPGSYAQLSFVAEAGTTYHIQAGGRQGRTGALSFSVRCSWDSDCDGALDFTDNCPSTPNPGQENADAGNTALSRAGADTLGDACDPDISGDGYGNVKKAPLGKNLLVYCPIMRADVDGDGVVTILDLSKAAMKFGQTFPPTDPSIGIDTGIQRLNQDADFVISILDLSKQASVFGKPVTLCP
jgi:subtilisin family serine protease